MAYYRVCERCGCNLDPGETCDCEEEEKRENELREKMFEGLIVQDGNTNQLVLIFGKEIAV